MAPGLITSILQGIKNTFTKPLMTNVPIFHIINLTDVLTVFCVALLIGITTLTVFGIYLLGEKVFDAHGW